MFASSINVNFDTGISKLLIYDLNNNALYFKMVITLHQVSMRGLLIAYDMHIFWS